MESKVASIVIFWRLQADRWVAWAVRPNPPNPPCLRAWVSSNNCHYIGQNIIKRVSRQPSHLKFNFFCDNNKILIVSAVVSISLRVIVTSAQPATLYNYIYCLLAHCHCSRTWCREQTNSLTVGDNEFPGIKIPWKPHTGKHVCITFLWQHQSFSNRHAIINQVQCGDGGRCMLIVVIIINSTICA